MINKKFSETHLISRGIQIYTIDGCLNSYFNVKQDIIKNIEYLNIECITDIFSDITQKEIRELQLLQEIIGYKRTFCETQTIYVEGIGNKPVKLAFERYI